MISFVCRYSLKYRRIGFGLAALLLAANVFAQTQTPSSRHTPVSDLGPDSSQEIFKWTNLLDKLALEARTLSEEDLRPEADAMQLALDLKRDANRIRMLAAIAGAAIKRIQSEMSEKNKGRANQFK